MHTHPLAYRRWKSLGPNGSIEDELTARFVSGSPLPAKESSVGTRQLTHSFGTRVRSDRRNEGRRGNPSASFPLTSQCFLLQLQIPGVFRGLRKLVIPPIRLLAGEFLGDTICLLPFLFY
jgi:hypothetical protein